jgi:hypothetical protein
MMPHSRQVALDTRRSRRTSSRLRGKGRIKRLRWPPSRSCCVVPCCTREKIETLRATDDTDEARWLLLEPVLTPAVATP